MNTRGVTLVEVLVVLGLLFLLTTFGSVASFFYFRTQYVYHVAETIANELRLVQVASLTQSDDASHGIKIFESTLTRFTGSSYAGRDTSKDVQTTFPVSVTVSGSQEVVIPAGQYGPAATSLTTITNNGIVIDISLTTYGVLTITNRTVGY